jgi:hypothetical protein
VEKHMILFEPTAGQVAVTETFLLKNAGKTSWNDPGSGTLKLFLPKAATKPEINATAPGGMNVSAPLNKTAKPDVWAVDFAIKPGDTRIDLTYSVPYTEGSDLAGKVVSEDENTYLIAPNGVTLKGDGLNDLGTEPRTQAHIFGLPAGLPSGPPATYKVQLTGAAVAVPGEPSAGDASGGDQATDDSGPRIEQIMPRVNSRKVPIILVALGILALGFVLLYRATPPAPPAPNPRGPRA